MERLDPIRMMTAFAAAVLFSAVAAGAEPAASPTVGPYFRVDFQDGFQGWAVQLFLGDSLVYRGQPWSDPIVSLAGSVELMGNCSIVEMRLRIKRAGIDSTFSIDIGAGGFVGIACLADSGVPSTIRILQSTVPFGYD
jgi:hypothetical protein